MRAATPHGATLRAHECDRPREFECQCCAKPICIDHMRFGRVPSPAPPAEPAFGHPAVYLCTKCAALEGAVGVEQFTATLQVVVVQAVDAGTLLAMDRSYPADE